MSPDLAKPTPPRQPLALLSLMRPLDWSKNTFVFAGLVFGHRWTDLETVRHALLAFAAFVATASSVYVANDLVDRERDAHHPEKRHRPLASGAVSLGAAGTLWLLLFGGGLFLAFLVSPTALILVILYAVLNVAYTLGLKRVVLLDVFIIASGFVLRILAGTVGIAIRPSPWILLCGLTLALFLGFCKRRAELMLAGDDPSKHREVLSLYRTRDLDQMIGICAACAIITYCLYTIDPKTQAAHGTGWLMSTAPFVIYGILRYIYRLHAGASQGRAAQDLARDPQLVVTVLGYVALMVWLLA